MTLVELVPDNAASAQFAAATARAAPLPPPPPSTAATHSCASSALPAPSRPPLLTTTPHRAPQASIADIRTRSSRSHQSADVDPSSLPAGVVFTARKSDRISPLLSAPRLCLPSASLPALFLQRA
ncbi:hypothetical protein M0R45_008356 [Rubus argutus]|uniref:Uncharacterized protein n=1 Tax=Rubus argutus TaxID=59490 RepID=A0AAW1Y3U2_RUBAR